MVFPRKEKCAKCLKDISFPIVGFNFIADCVFVRLCKECYISWFDLKSDRKKVEFIDEILHNDW